MQRRSFLTILALVPFMTLLKSASAFGVALGANLKDVQANWKTLLAPNASVAADSTPLKLSDDEWKKRLPPDSYSVLRKEGTERPGSSPLDHEIRPGVFVCLGCNLPLFSSAMKFDSGTGWPSFFTSIPGAMQTKHDFAMIVPRTEYHCAKCGGHQGHVFDDGPQPTGQRWCNNGVALRFIAKTA
jgi:peptide-methionine (R)-S-oxide reductase